MSRWIIDVDALLKKIPRPERSGLIAVVIALCALYEVVTPSYPLEHPCQLLPAPFAQMFSDCAKETEAEYVKKEIRNHHVYYLVGGGKGRNDLCTAEFRWRFPADKDWKYSKGYVAYERDDLPDYSNQMPINEWGALITGVWWELGTGKQSVFTEQDRWNCPEEEKKRVARLGKEGSR